MHRHPVLVCVGLLLGAAAGAQTPDDEFKPFPQDTGRQSSVPGTSPAPAVAAPPAPPVLGPAPSSSAPLPGETPGRLLPGSPPAAPSTLGNGWLDVANLRLSQGLFGGLGTLAVSSADIGRAGILRFAASGEYYTNSGWLRASDEATGTTGTFAVDYVVLDWLELYASYAASGTTSTGSNPHFISAVGDVGLGAKAAWRLSSLFALALDVRAARLPGLGTQALSDAGYTLSPYLLFAWTPPLPLRVAVQLGAQFQWSSELLSEPGSIEDDVALGRTAYHQLLAGLALEFPIPWVTPFVEFTTGVPLNVHTGTLTGANGNALPIHAALPYQLNAGLKVSLVQNLTFLLAGQFSLQGSVAVGVPALPPWNLVFAATYAVDVFPVPATRVVAGPAEVVAPATGTVVGVVTDAVSAAPLAGVVVSAAGQDMAPVASEAATGRFATRPLPPGPTQLQLHKDGYQDAPLAVTVEAGHATEVKAALTPLSKTSHFLVTTTARKKAVAATVKFSGAEAKVVQTKADATGPEVVPAMAGAYVVEVTAEGYLAQLREVELTAGAELQLAFELQPEPKKKRVVLRDDRLELLVQVHFAPGRSTILADSYALLDEVVDAVVRFGIKRVRVEGYTDSSGSRPANLRLSQTRAEAVTEYLAQKGIARNRLEAKGYGDARPIAPNLTARGRELNRRVEIVVLER